MLQKRIFNLGFALSTALLLVAIGSGAETFERFDQSGFHYISTSPAFRWSTLLFVALNLPPVAIAAVMSSALGHIFGLSLKVVTVVFLPLVLSVSAYWWRWIEKRAEKRRL